MKKLLTSVRDNGALNSGRWLSGKPLPGWASKGNVNFRLVVEEGAWKGADQGREGGRPVVHMLSLRGPPGVFPTGTQDNGRCRWREVGERRGGRN